MRIGYLAAEWGHSYGWAHYSTSLIQALQKQGVELTIIGARNTDIPYKQDIHALLPTLVPPDSGTLRQMLINLPQIQRLFADCEIIHSTVEIYAPLAAMLAGNRPLFTTIHGSYAHLPTIRRWPINHLYRWAFQQSTLVCVSHYTEQVVQSIVSDADTVVINNGVDIERFENLPAFDEPVTRPTIVTSGGVKMRKGTLELVKAMPAVREAFPDVHCIVMGTTTAEEDYVALVRRTIAELELEDCVKILGFVDEPTLLRWYNAADVYVLPSINAGWKFEGFGLSTFEASAAGLPVIGTTDCGAEDAIEHGVTGLLVEQANVSEALAPAIIELLRNKARATQMGRAGKRKATNQTWDIVAQQMINLYENQKRSR